MTVTVFGIRHHGPGSARSLVSALRSLEPDCVLVEGPSEADAMIPLASHAGMKPPVALLVYDPQRTSDASFFPFAAFSPEWQAILYALDAGVPVRFIDLPYGQLISLRRQQARHASEADADADADHDSDFDAGAADVSATASASMSADPIGVLSAAAGEPDGERWWDKIVESRRVAGDVFEAIAEAMTAVRSAIPDEDPVTAFREAAMRRSIRAAGAGGHERIAVVCGAWHVPALIDRPSAAYDARLLKSVPAATKVSVAWVPWTYERLSADSGYGAGIPSPGWYEHLWSGAEPLAVTWMARVARTFRAEDLDISPAHLIEATRLAETLAALRGRAIPSLEELTQAIRTVVTLGSDVEMAVVRDRLIVGRAMGTVPDDVPVAPLAADLAREQRRLRLRPEQAGKTLDLDLRGATDLDRSRLLHRLRTLDVPWGSPQVAIGKAGTFHEIWNLAWKPEFVVSLIAMSRFGATIAEAASARVVEVAKGSDRLAELTALVESALLADLPDAVEAVVERIGAIAAVATDVPSLMAALPPLARVVRYGNVRATDAGAVATVVEGFVERIAIGLPGACASLDDDAAAAIVPLIVGTDSAIALLNRPDQIATWRATLARLQDQTALHGLVAGRVCRLLLDDRAIDTDEATRRMRLALSRGATPAAAASWVEGFLGDSGTILLHDQALFGVLDAWVSSLGADAFEPVLPLMRRTVATFPAPERRALGERVSRADAVVEAAPDGGLDPVRADAVLPILSLLLGVRLHPTATEAESADTT